MLRRRAIVSSLFIVFSAAAVAIAGEMPLWEQVVGQAGGVGPGFGDTNNVSILSSAVRDGYLYYATQNPVTGCEVWRSADGESWEQVNSDGFGSPENQGGPSMALFSGDLFVGTFVGGVNRTGTRIWRSGDGTSWAQVNSDGFGDPGNADPDAMSTFDGALYVAVTNFTSGVEVWRTPDGTSWSQVNQDGFGDPDNGSALAMTEYLGALYAATANDVTGTQVWRTSNGSSWTQVNVSGFGSSLNMAGWAADGFGENLYVSTGTVIGSQVWRSEDGNDWFQVNGDGFGDGFNWAVLSLIPFQNTIVAGTWNMFTGAEVWGSFDGALWTQINDDGFGVPSNDAVVTLTELKNDLYAGVRGLGPCEVWRLSTAIFSEDFEGGAAATGWSEIIW